MSKAYELLIQYDRRLENMLIQVNAGDAFSGEGRTGAAEAAASMNEQAAVICEEANEEMTRILREETDSLLSQVLLITSNHMKNAYSRSDH